mgnify:CR=1 FL=1
MAKKTLTNVIKSSHSRISNENSRALKEELRLAKTYGKSHTKKNRKKKPKS